MGIITDAIDTGTRGAKNFIDYAESIVVNGTNWGLEAEGRVEKGLKHFDRAVNYDIRPEVEGEAKVVSPLQFLQFTPLKIVGVTRLPQAGAEGIGWIYKNRNILIGGVSKSKSWIKNQKLKEGLQNSKQIIEKQSKRLSEVTPARVKRGLKEVTPKNPRTAGMMTGAIISGIVMNPELPKKIGEGLSAMSGQSKRNDDLEHAEFLYSRKVSRKRWF